MCGRFIPLTTREFADLLRDLGVNVTVVNEPSPTPATAQPSQPIQPTLPFTSLDELGQTAAPQGDAFPGSMVPIAFRRDGAIQIALRRWGFELPSVSHLVFNARIEKACERGSVWNQMLHEGRCIVASRGFFEPHATQTMPSPRTGKPIKVPYLFTLPHHNTLLMAGICNEDAFSLLTCAPNRWVAPIHNRMPLVLEHAESLHWVDAAYPGAPDCTQVQLDACPMR